MAKRYGKKKSTRRIYIYKRGGHKSKRKIPIAVVGGALMGSMASLSGGDSIFTSVTKGVNGQTSWDNVGNTLGREIIGYDAYAKRWAMPTLTVGLVGGALISKLASKFGLNKMLSDIPMVKI